MKLNKRLVPLLRYCHRSSWVGLFTTLACKKKKNPSYSPGKLPKHSSWMFSEWMKAGSRSRSAAMQAYHSSCLCSAQRKLVVTQRWGAHKRHFSGALLGLKKKKKSSLCMKTNSWQRNIKQRYSFLDSFDIRVLHQMQFVINYLYAFWFLSNLTAICPLLCHHEEKRLYGEESTCWTINVSNCPCGL